jgi:predicted metal-dependent phosphoesterase TrpH
MRIDFHCHALLTTLASFDPVFLAGGLRHARHIGLDAICLCDHSHAPHYEEVHRWLENACTHSNGACAFEGLFVYAGLETNIAPQGHILVLGDSIRLTTLQRRLTSQYTGVNPWLEELIDCVGSTGPRECFLIIGAHPARPGQELFYLSPRRLNLLDALDLNGRDVGRWREIRRKMRGCPLPMIAGSDSHHPCALGSAFTILDLETGSEPPPLALIGEKLRAGAYCVKASVWHWLKNRRANLEKRKILGAMKESVNLPAQPMRKTP